MNNYRLIIKKNRYDIKKKSKNNTDFLKKLSLT